ncbi:rRNA maturation RNase YbeY [Mesoflavibacter sabulilitoris]|uniref:Endoribonuclease YbeY n=1 Tax=Mesoflavibacter zeaxanthinifaciens subsp. sabulilitoris TaxID=1520893 RepID=A0A2T1N6P4_9FLAO|nr:rRNA maturation RNase YbeY [Mesoflavibacter zeaxanthinifaciens]MBB3123145.1 rRNA maturation RNase YbeY [Mesoflavibacter zeaxanthinifaciens subsp. sabulilitoris]PSG87214.1 rRNA maturation RNase YbeY [Mesoflavibacter zeaxanthinifaciens subsp. sabulilitoris]
MISFNYETDFKLLDEAKTSSWISKIIEHHNCKKEEISYVFCDDEYLHRLNVQYLNHDTLTDIISFDYSIGKTISGDIFISVERVEDNAKYFDVDFNIELHRVIIHGILHYCGFKDKTEDDAKLMRAKEDEALFMLKEMS